MAKNSTFSYSVEFRHQSQGITFSDWISLLTVCLAPLIAHLIAGAPKVVHLNGTTPPWHETIVHYNPTSIIWRYCAVVDRRARAHCWNNIDMAAVNALFWTSHGWDGSEAMITKSQEICIRQPPPLLRRLFSTDALKTVIVTLQGAQAVYLIAYNHSDFSGFAVDSIFMPLAFIGLLRLPSALWLTDEYLFMDQEGPEVSPMVQSRALPKIDDVAGLGPPAKPLLEVSMSAMSHETIRPTLSHGAFSLRGLGVGLFYTSFLLGSLGLTLYRTLPLPHREIVDPLTPVLTGYSYAVLLVVTWVLMVFYWVRDRSSTPSTVIPCVSTVWYKVYTGVIMTMIVLMMVIAALETRRLPCGPYTTTPVAFNDELCTTVYGTNVTASTW